VPHPLSPATVTRRAAPALRTVKTPAFGNWMNWRSLRSSTLVTIPASGVVARAWTWPDRFVTARTSPRRMVRRAGLNASAPVMATLVALVQSTADVVVVRAGVAAACGGAGTAGAQAVKVSNVAAVAQSLRCTPSGTAGDES
jgi:hypothetical protein